MDVHNNISKGKIEAFLDTVWLGKQITVLSSTTSTNDVAKRMALTEDAAHGAVILAEHQTSGRGRMGRQWQNTAGKDICMSLVLWPDIKISKAPLLALATAVGVSDALEQTGIKNAIKWPNDILCGGKKLSGILLESSVKPDPSFFVIVGIGLNVNQTNLPEGLDAIATSLALQSGKETDRNILAAKLLNRLEPVYQACETPEGCAYVLESYRSKCITLKRHVTVRSADKVLSGTAEHIDELGRLCLRTPDGLLALSSGDVTMNV